MHAYASFDDPQMESNRDIATYIGIAIDLGPHSHVQFCTLYSQECIWQRHITVWILATHNINAAIYIHYIYLY